MSEYKLVFCANSFAWSMFPARLHILRADKKVRSHTFSWVEHCGWIPFLLCGETDVKKMKRSRCAAGHKALWAEKEMAKNKTEAA